MTSRIILGAVILGLSGGWAIAQDADKSMSLAYQIEKNVNTLVDFTSTSCIPGAGSEAGTTSFILLSSEPIFSVEAAKKPWIIVAVGAAGDVLNRNSSVPVENIVLTDSSLMKRRIIHVIPAERVKSLQRKISSDQITLDQLYREILKSLKQQRLPDE